jgi:putative transposase
VDTSGQTIDVLLIEHREKDAAFRFFTKAIRRNGVPETITIDGSHANEAAIKRENQERGTAIARRQGNYLNNIIAQDHRAVSPRRGFTSFGAAQGTLAGIALMHRRKKGQLVGVDGAAGLTSVEPFSTPAAPPSHQSTSPDPR